MRSFTDSAAAALSHLKSEMTTARMPGRGLRTGTGAPRIQQAFVERAVRQDTSDSLSRSWSYPFSRWCRSPDSPGDTRGSPPPPASCGQSLWYQSLLAPPAAKYCAVVHPRCHNTVAHILVTVLLLGCSVARLLAGFSA